MIERGDRVVVVHTFRNRANVSEGQIGTVEAVHHNDSCKVDVKLRKGGIVQLPEECLKEI